MASLTVTVLRGAPMLCGTAVNCTWPTTPQAETYLQTCCTVTVTPQMGLEHNVDACCLEFLCCSRQMKAWQVTFRRRELLSQLVIFYDVQNGPLTCVSASLTQPTVGHAAAHSHGGSQTWLC